MRKPSLFARRSAVASGAMTGVSVALVSAAAAVAGVVLAHKFGRTAESDGFFAAYSLYIGFNLAANALRIVVMPRLAAAEQAGRLGTELIADALALAFLAVPSIVLAVVASGPIADLLTGDIPPEGHQVAADAIVWLVPAAIAQLYGSLLGGALAALDDYLAAAMGFAGAGVVALVLFVLLADAHGTVSLAWGLAAGSTLALGVPLVELWRRRRELEWVGGPLRLRARMGDFAAGVAVPLALQGLFVVAIRFAGEIGVGSVTSLSYAYIIAAVLVSVSASSLAIVSSVPLTRRGLEPDGVVAHVVSATWLSLTLVFGATGVFALAGEPVLRRVLGSSFGGDVGAELGRLVVYLAPWSVVSIALAVTFPLLFVAGRTRLLPWLAVGALAVHVPVEWVCWKTLGLGGIAGGLAVTTALVLVALLLLLSPAAARRLTRGLASPMLVTGVLAIVSFSALAPVLDPLPAAAGGLALYAALLAALRPRGLRDAWAYVRAL